MSWLEVVLGILLLISLLALSFTLISVDVLLERVKQLTFANERLRKELALLDELDG